MDFSLQNINSVISIKQLIEFQTLVLNAPVSDHIIEYTVKFVRSTRLNNNCNEITKKWLNWGAGPRASSMLVMAAKAYALINGRTTPEIEDVKEMIKPILRHRIIPNFNAEAEGFSADKILEYLIDNQSS